MLNTNKLLFCNNKVYEDKIMLLTYNTNHCNNSGMLRVIMLHYICRNLSPSIDFTAKYKNDPLMKWNKDSNNEECNNIYALECGKKLFQYELNSSYDNMYYRKVYNDNGELEETSSKTGTDKYGNVCELKCSFLISQINELINMSKQLLIQNSKFEDQNIYFYKIMARHFRIINVRIS